MIARSSYKHFMYIILLLPPFFCTAHNKNLITVIGTGYVGLVTGACLAEIGNTVICADIDTKKIDLLKNNCMPIYEQGLAEIVARNVAAKRLAFTDNVSQAIADADIIFIAVGTPMGEKGNADLSYIYAAVDTIAQNLTSHKIIVTKSTVPIGTGKSIRAKLEEEWGIDSQLFSVASNPEFLREGLAVQDFLQPDRIVIGTDSDAALVALYEVYEPLIAAGVNHILTDIQTAEMIKYAANGFLSVKISYINEIANLCDEVDADVVTVAYAMGLDHRISPYFLNPGPGFGGSCFPKDAQALVFIAQQHDLPFFTVQAALDANSLQQKTPVKKLTHLLAKKYNQTLVDKTIAVLGLAFKANTDDIRYSPAITTITELLNAGAIVKAYDPIAMPNMSQLFPQIIYGDSVYSTVADADAIIIMTDWDEIKQMNFNHVKALVNQPIIIDARNIINPETLKELGFDCDTIGQSYLCKKRYEALKRLMPIHVRKRMLCTKVTAK